MSAASGMQRPRRRPGENRAGLLAAGTVEFGIHGYAAAQTGAIARRAGVSQPNVYANFASKRDLFVACVSELHIAVQTSLAPNLGSSAPTKVDDARPELYTAQKAPGEALEGSDATRGCLADEHALLLYQAIAALGDAQVSQQLRSIVEDIRDALGRSAYDRAILRAAELLIELH